MRYCELPLNVNGLSLSSFLRAATGSGWVLYGHFCGQFEAFVVMNASRTIARNLFLSKNCIGLIKYRHKVHCIDHWSCRVPPLHEGTLAVVTAYNVNIEPVDVNSAAGVNEKALISLYVRTENEELVSKIRNNLRQYLKCEKQLAFDEQRKTCKVSTTTNVPRVGWDAYGDGRGGGGKQFLGKFVILGMPILNPFPIVSTLYQIAVLIRVRICALCQTPNLGSKCSTYLPLQFWAKHYE